MTHRQQNQTALLNCRTHTGDDSRSDNVGVINDNPNVSDYFRSSPNKGVDKETSRLITQKFIAILAIYSQ